ncbi:LacI family DNA-binding transcriptional regulator [Asticcacaulis sp. ZE23SCel15]|uniref:LacI family DNA-binding transcriptional regulator n=1 Tax=Asticcacaulis sp. ZE23SCel15 TaxID=3059027 RepID=UPI00265F1715|nr:LacI family DNA-binding transcriptional regulator [Asticcacaulis sp. ZE23SCel15]WKL59017.1 LacI family DNA-binding transcriptional regulator [Asticcacaulis sp. ZE23SCel15]
MKASSELKPGVNLPASGTVSTINDVARLAGVSIKTVSRVMNNEPNVRAETRVKVQEAANLLHYRPNLLARSLAGARSFLIGIFYDNPNPSYINAVQNGAIRRCRESSYHLLIEPQDAHSPDLERNIAGLLATIRLDGVILTPPLCDMAVVLHAVEAAGVPYVRISPFLNPGRSPIVRMDEARATYEMTQHLIAMGHRDIGFVLGHPEHGGTHLRYQGFTKALSEAGITPRPDWVKQGFFSYESGVEAGKSFFAEGKPRPSAIFSSNDYMAFGIMGVAQQMGIRIPEDISICGFDDAPGSILIWPHVTTIRQPVEDIAYAAADILLAKAEVEDEDGTKRDTDRLLPFELIKRNSVGPV